MKYLSADTQCDDPRITHLEMLLAGLDERKSLFLQHADAVHVSTKDTWHVVILKSVEALCVELRRMRRERAMVLHLLDAHPNRQFG